MSSSAYPAPGDRLGPYRVGHRLGGGGMGVVFEALDTTLNRQVALKIISPHLADDASFGARFAREAQAQAGLDSPHVVHVYAFGEDDGRLWIAAQLVPDGDLGALLRQYGPPPLATAVDLLAQVTSGLADAHAAGLVHRDIKPANVLLRRRESGLRAYLADFGIARHLDDQQQLTTMATPGTPSYMAPELHTGGKAGTASDVYSLGCLLWTTLTGRPPYDGATVYEVAGAHLHEPVPQLAGDGPRVAGLNRVLSTALAKDPAQRHPTAAALRDDLLRVLTLPDQAPPPVPTEPPPTPAQVPVPRRPSRARLALVLALVVLLVGAGLGTAWAVTRDDEPAAADAPGRSQEPSDDLSPSTDEPTDEPTDSAATGGASSYVVRPGDEEKAAASLATALEGTAMVPGDLADCVAREWIAATGLQEMVDRGFFDEDLQFVDQPRSAVDAEMTQQVTAAAQTCAVQGGS